MASPAPRIQLAERTARQVLLDHSVVSLPVDPFAIAAACDILVEPKPSANDGVSGMLIRLGESFGILYATHIPSEGFQRFSVSHELGHYFLAGHPEQLLTSGAHASRANFASGDPYEVEADMFAAALLMPRTPFTMAARAFDDGLDAIVGLSAQCRTSLTAAAVSYVRYSRCAVAIVQSLDGVVEFCAVSDALKTEPIGWLRRGARLPPSSLTRHFASDRANINHARTGEGEGRLSDWFSRAKAHAIREEVIGLGRFGRVLTVLHCPAMSLSADGYDIDDKEEAEEDVMERWAVRFH